MGRLFFIMGKSSTGKDSIFKKLLEREELHLCRVVPYTTRPIREGETDGIDYNFCTEEDEKRLKNDGKIIEMRSYPTVHGRWDYFTVDDDSMDFSDDLVTIGTLESFVKIREYYKNHQVIPIYIEVEDGTRLFRALERERKQLRPRYEELCRRFLADSEDFSEDKLAELGITHRFSNEDVDKTVCDIADFIKGIQNGH